MDLFNQYFDSLPHNSQQHRLQGNGLFFPTKIYILDKENGNSVGGVVGERLLQLWGLSSAKEYSLCLSNNRSTEASPITRSFRPRKYGQQQIFTIQVLQAGIEST